MSEDSVIPVTDGWEDLMGDGIRKCKIRDGAGESASMGTIVKCNLTGYILNSETPFETLRDQTFKIGETDTIPALELSLRLAKIGEIYKVRCSSKFGYGPTERPEIKGNDGSVIPAIPPDSSLEYHVEVLEHIDVSKIFVTDSSTNVPSSRDGALYECNLRKECGNRWFSYREFTRAGRAYSKGAEFAENYLKSFDNSEVGEVDPEGLLMSAYVSCLNNLSACHLENRDYLKSKEVSTRHLSILLFVSMT